MSTSSSANLDKVYDTASAALSGLAEGATVLIGGYAGQNLPDALLRALIDSGIGDLTVVCHGAGIPRDSQNDIHALVKAGLVRRMISPLPFDPRHGGPVKQLWESRQLELEVQPVGILAERIRAGGAGIGGFFYPVAAGTRFAQGREVRSINGREHLFQPAIKANFALIRAAVADTFGNLSYAGTGRNSNPVMAMAAGVTVAEVDEIRQIRRHRSGDGDYSCHICSANSESFPIDPC